MNLPWDIVWRSHDIIAVIIGLRGNAMAAVVVKLMRSVVVAARASGMNGSVLISPVCPHE